MVKLYKIEKNNKKVLILDNIINTKGVFQKSRGLMLANKKKCQKGMLFEFLKDTQTRFGASITMFMCFYPLDVVFIDKNFEIVDKVTIKPFKWNYTPKKFCQYVVEVYKSGFSNLKIGDKVKIQKS